jgi:hypothetical protein
MRAVRSTSWVRSGALVKPASVLNACLVRRPFRDYSDGLLGCRVSQAQLSENSSAPVFSIRVTMRSPGFSQICFSLG